MSHSTPTSTISSTDLRNSLDLMEIKPGVRFSKGTLADLLPDVETALFFGKVFALDYQQLSNLLYTVLQSDLAVELFGKGHEHSHHLQDFLVDGYYDEDENWHDAVVPKAKRGDVTFAAVVPKGEILPEVWKSLETEVAASIAAVAAKLEKTIGLMPGKQGSMVFKSMMKMNAQRPTLGVHKAAIHHAPQRENLVILDVSGSMTESTIRRIINDVVALSYTANAHMAVVSNTTTHWDPGSYGVDDVLKACEFGGTHYESLADLLRRDWGTVVTVADYDSSPSSKDYIRTQCGGHIEQVLDVSLVNRPTFLAECVGQLAGSVKPILIATTAHVLQ